MKWSHSAYVFSQFKNMMLVERQFEFPNLEFFSDQSMFKEHHDRSTFSIDVTVFHQRNHTINIHLGSCGGRNKTFRIRLDNTTHMIQRLTGEKLQVLKSSQKVFHHFAHVCLESVYF